MAFVRILDDIDKRNSKGSEYQNGSRIDQTDATDTNGDGQWRSLIVFG